ncbi:TMEM164-related integral membrane acyltransferase [Thiohalorhabdus sp.]|uniref:TMEM164-related integral membrane acyltransferase n=1 Tax=Thiohalorhabdus sp. TaxID=3094134 RepID=UPI002FC37885
MPGPEWRVAPSHQVAMASGGSFSLFGISHFAALAVVGVVVLAAAMGRRNLLAQAPPALRWPLGALVLAQFAAWYAVYRIPQGFSPARDLPLQLCDINQLLLVAYLWRPRAGLFDLLYYWVLSASSLALLLPDLEQDFPSVAYASLFGSHGLTLAILVHLAFGRGRGPVPASAGRAWAWLLGYGIVLVPVDLLLGANYLYLLELPALPGPLAALVPPAPWHWLLVAAFMYLLFRGMQAIAPPAPLDPDPDEKRQA